MNVKHTSRVIFISLAAGLLIDFLFWKQTPGISVPIFVALLLAGLIYLTFSEDLRPPLTSCLLFIPILFFAVFASIREEPFTVFICWLLMIVCMGILAMTWTGGLWLKFNLTDYLIRFIQFVGGVFSLPFEKVFSNKQPEAGEGQPINRSNAASMWKRVGIPAAVGLVIAAPMVCILGNLLANADPIFKTQITDVLEFFSIPDFGEFLLQTFLVVVFAFLFCGALLFSLLKSKQEKLYGLEEPFLGQPLSWITTTIVIFSVDLLFAFFVYVQFRYFFGGQANIVQNGFTYAEYARSGFNELLMVAFISLLLFLGLSAITKRTQGSGRRFYSVLGILLVLMVGVILASAFQRLGLYEAAYGFTRIRTYSHIFIIWLGILLAATVFLEIVNRLRSFALASLLIALGFGISLTLLNVDGFIVRQNIARAVQGEELDIPHLVWLSDDAIPDLLKMYQQTNPNSETHDQILGIFACRLKMNLRNPRPGDWRSFHWSNYSAQTILEQFKSELPTGASYIDDPDSVVIQGTTIPCMIDPLSRDD